jgi:alpha-ketoglutarate-dependent taurine dioxygenase
MASYRRIEVKPVAGALGAEVSGVELASLDDGTFDEIKTAWLEYLVLFFHNRLITPDQQIAFARRFGDIHQHPFMKHMDEHPEILEIIKEEGDTRAFGEVWHTDQIFNPKPAKATILYAKETPNAGGDTLFANMYLAYEALSDPMKAPSCGRQDLERRRPQEADAEREDGHDARCPLCWQREDGGQGARPGRPADGGRAPHRAHPPRDRPQGALHQQSHANTPRLQACRSAANRRFFTGACGRT